VAQANGEGTIYRRGDRWEGQTFVDGKRVTRSGKTRAIVKKRLGDAAVTKVGAPKTVAQLAEIWSSELLPQEGLTDRSVHWYRDLSRRYVLPHLGRLKLAELSIAHVEKMTAGMVDKGLSPRTAASARTCVGKMLRAAERRDWVAKNVAYLATPPKDKGVAKKNKALSPAELETLLRALGDDSLWHTIALLGVSTGLRPGELLALHWDDIKDGHLTVRHAVVAVPGGGSQLKAPKRQRSYRTVPVPASVLELLEGLPRISDLMFPNPQGDLRRVDSFRLALTRAGGVHPHQLRHTYATHLLEQGVPIHHVAELLGDTVAVVESTYSHVLRPKTEVLGVLDTLLPK
jgi:integrase